MSAAVPPNFVTASHAVLFTDDSAKKCDVCGGDVPPDDDESASVSGSALYVWSRGEERRYEEPPLCADCAAAIGLTALSRWEIEEEEG